MSKTCNSKKNNWDLIDGTYPLANACGQLEQSYQDYVCPAGSEHMQCEVDLNMEQRATTNAGWYGAPGPLFCGPKSKYPHVGYWDYSFMCDYPWKDPPELCPDYPGQKGGKAVNDEPVENRVSSVGCLKYCIVSSFIHAIVNNPWHHVHDNV